MTKTNTRSRIVSILLVLVMLLTMVPITGVTANAAEWTTVNSYEQFEVAMTAEGQRSIKLGSDIDTGTLNSGMGLLDTLAVKGQKQLDLNGHTLRLFTQKSALGDLIKVENSSLTLSDSSAAQTGRILGVTSGDADVLINVWENGKFTMNSGKLEVEVYTGSLRGVLWRRTIDCHYGGEVVINGGTLYVPPKTYEDSNAYTTQFFDEFDDLHNGSCGYTLIANNNSKVTINGGTFQGPVRMNASNSKWNKTTSRVIITGGTFEKDVVLNGAGSTTGDGKVTLAEIKGGTFLGKVQAWAAASFESSFSTPEVVISGGEFSKEFWLRPKFPLVNDKEQRGMAYHVAAKLKGGNFHEGFSADKNYGNYLYSASAVKQRLKGYEIYQLADKLLGQNAIQTGNGTFAAQDYNSYNKYITNYRKSEHDSGGYAFIIKAVNNQPTTIIPNAWGMKSVTLDGKKIDYFKDWKGTVENMNNDEAHTLKFEWYPLASELVNAGYTYRTTCEHYISGSTAVQQTDTIAADKTSHTVTIPAGADPKVYSYDLQLNLDKNGSSVGIFSNQHIVKLVVSEAPVVDTRTSIESVTLKVPKLKEGAASGDNFTLSGTNTGVSTINTVWEGIPASGAVAGNFYAARITLTAKDGYAFNTNTQVKLNGDYLSTGSGINNGGAGMTIYVNVLVRHEHNFGTWQIAGTGNVHFRKCSCGVQEEKPHEWKYLEGQDKYKCTVCGYEIDGEKERITYVYASPRSPIVGEHPGDYTPAEWVKISGANYKVESIVWKNMDDTDVTTFEAGKIYKGTVTFKADTGFAFDGDRIYASQIFNSSNAEVVGNYTLADGGTTLTATFKLKDANVVKPGLKAKVKLPTLSNKVGQNLPAAELVETTLPENVELVYSVYEDNLLGEAITDPDYKVKPNQKYVYAVWLKYGDSTDITEITKTYNVSYEVTDGGDTENYTDLVGYGVLAIYQTPDTSKINSVALTVTAPKYGKAPATTATGANDTRYTVGTPTWSPAVTDGKFGAAAYTVSIPVTAAEGYSFDANCIYTVNGYVATYADGKVSYTFPQLIAPHTHDTDAQPWVYMDPGTHIKTCTAGDDFKVEAHTFSAWTKVDESTHSRTCSKCKKSGEATNYTETAKHTWVWVVDKEAVLNQPGKQHEECTGCHAKRSENTEIPALRDYAVTVTGGTATVAAGTSITRAMEGVEVTVTADAPKTGRVFDKWVVKAGGVTLANETSATTTFSMPGNDVKIEATYKDAPPSHSVYVGMTYTAGNFIYQITSIDTATLGKSKVIGVVAAKKNKITKVTIPDRADCKGYRLNVTAVGDKAFKSMKKLKKVTFGSNVKVIGKNAFSNCKKLDKISFKNVTTIGNDAFAGCKALKKLTIGNKVTVIGKNAFKKCSKLKTVVIGKAVKTISSKAFIGDNKIKKITFKGKKLKTVKKNAFSKKAKKNIKSKKTKLKGNKKAIKLFKKKLKIK